MTTIKDALEQGTAVLAQADLTVIGPRLDAQVLLGHVLHVDRAMLYAYPEHLLTLEQEQQFKQLIVRRILGEPVAYLVGHKEFFGLDLLVDKRVLIPRPETEMLVEAALSTVRDILTTGRIPLVADIGTGSGAIPIALAVEEPRLPYVYACDISAGALDVARLNCTRHHVEQRIRLLQGDLLAPLPEPVDVLTANLPYVGTDEMHLLTPDVRAYEPHLALFSGQQGVDLLSRLFTEAQQPGKLHEHAVLLLEIGYQQRDLLASLLHDFWPQAKVTFEKDYAGWDRLLKVIL
ncbi:MAG: peptide chain release factor N(5)-glutamine methyltransferase [Ktedonobacteraceae bacterium]